MNVTAKIHNPEAVTLDGVVAEAREIFRRVKDSGVAVEDVKGRNQLFEELRRDYHDFSISYPLVLRLMTQLDEFDPRVFRDFVEWVTGKLSRLPNGVWKTRDDFLMSQAEYALRLWKKKNRRAGAGRARTYKMAIYDQLVKENKEFDEMKKLADERLAELKVEARAWRKDRISEGLQGLSPEERKRWAERILLARRRSEAQRAEEAANEEQRKAALAVIDAQKKE